MIHFSLEEEIEQQAMMPKLIAKAHVSTNIVLILAFWHKTLIYYSLLIYDVDFTSVFIP